MHEEKYTQLIAGHLTGELSDGEQAEFDAWLNADPEHQAILDSYRKLWDVTDTESDYQPDVKAGLSRFEQAMEASEAQGGKVIDFQSRKKSSSSWWVSGAAAAMVIGLLGWLIVNAGQQAVIEVAAGPDKTQTVTLPDGSTVQLNVNSTLSYSEDFEVRDVQLKGEAFFEVQHNPESPFRVVTPNTETTVLGTSFNVRAYGTETREVVTVRTGKVAVAAEEGQQKVTLVAGQQAVKSGSEELIMRSSDTDRNALSWNTGKLVFPEGTPLKSIVQDLERHFGVRIRLVNPELETCAFREYSRENPELKTIFELIEASTSTTITQRAGTYEIDGSGCE